MEQCDVRPEFCTVPLSVPLSGIVNLTQARRWRPPRCRSAAAYGPLLHRSLPVPPPRDPPRVQSAPSASARAAPPPDGLRSRTLGTGMLCRRPRGGLSAFPPPRAPNWLRAGASGVRAEGGGRRGDAAPRVTPPPAASPPRPPAGAAGRGTTAPGPVPVRRAAGRRHDETPPHTTPTAGVPRHPADRKGAARR